MLRVGELVGPKTANRKEPLPTECTARKETLLSPTPVFLSSISGNISLRFLLCSVDMGRTAPRG